MGFVDLTTQQTGVVILILAIVSILAEERLANLDSIFHGFLAPSEQHLARSRKAIAVSSLALGALGCGMLLAGFLGF